MTRDASPTDDRISGDDPAHAGCAARPRRPGAAVAGGLPGILAQAQAPAAPRGTRLHLLQWSHFVQAADTLFDQQAAEFGKQAGVQVPGRADQPERHPGARDGGRPGADRPGHHHHREQPRRTSTRPPWRTCRDVAEEIGRRAGRLVRLREGQHVSASGRWIGVPQFIISWADHLPRGLVQGSSGSSTPETWDEFRTAGWALKAKGRPYGQAFGHSINDPNNWCYPLVWMWGGMEVDKDGKTVVIDTKAVVEAVKFNKVALEGSASTRAASAGTTRTTTARSSRPTSR